MKIYPVAVSGTRLKENCIEKRVEKKLSRFGLDWDGIEFSGQVKAKKLKKLRQFCESENPKLRLKITNSMGQRRTDYRRRYFASHKPDVGSRYICVYCGKWLKKDRVTVDHLYPVGKLSRDVKLQKKLEKKGIRNVNDPKNLVAACPSCNSRKANHMGLWVLRGKLGQNPLIWMARYLFRAAIVAGGVWAGWYLYTLLT